MEVTGLEGYEVGISHPDVSGIFGGYKAWMVHYESEDGHRLEVYRHVGEYGDIGCRSDSQGSSKWEVVNKVIDFVSGKILLSEVIQVLHDYARKPE